MLTTINFTLSLTFLTINILYSQASRIKLLANTEFNSSLQIELPNGTVQGTERVTTEARVPFLAFQGIPYAKAPVGELRFRSPEWFPKWNGVLDATTERSSCMQIFRRGHEPGSEDCLFLNIYTPKISVLKYFGVQVPNVLVHSVAQIKKGFKKNKNRTSVRNRKTDRDKNSGVEGNLENDGETKHLGLKEIDKLVKNGNNSKSDVGKNLKNNTDNTKSIGLKDNSEKQIDEHQQNGNNSKNGEEDNLDNPKNLGLKDNLAEFERNGNNSKGSSDSEKKQKKKKHQDGERLAVMVFIYGGAFIDGFSNMSIYGPDYILEQGVIFVSINYRVGVFGFFSTSDLVCPGNFGLKDIILALSWIQLNIHFFGGDPQKVTIFGHSAGAACVSYIIQAPQARGLFSSAIMQSGSALCPWSLNRSPQTLARMIGLSVGLLGSNSSTLVKKLRTVDATTLNNIIWAMVLKSATVPINGLIISPVIEPHHPDAVITGYMHELFKNGTYNHVPIIMGFTSQEASVFQNYVNLGRPIFAHWDLQPSLLVPNNMNLKTNTTDRRNIGNLIKEFYFGEKYIATSSRIEILNYIGDSQFVRSIRENAKLCAPVIPVYLYQFSYQGLLGKLGIPLSLTDRLVTGVGHVEDLWYIFKKENLTTHDKTDIMVRQTMVKLWTNFAKFRNPTPNAKELNIRWPEVNKPENDSVCYLNIDSKLDIRYNPHDEAMKFWDELYRTYGNPPYDNY